MNRVGRNVGMLLVIATMAVTTFAGEIQIAWDPVAGAAGYHVYYGVQSGVYGSFVPAATNSATITGLQDCRAYYVAVKAFNGAGESPSFSNELSGWSHPTVISVTPSSAMQGDQIVMDIMGTNFPNDAVVDLSPNRICSVPESTHVLQYKQCKTDTECALNGLGTCLRLNTVNLTSVSVLSCSHIQLLATVEPTAWGVRPAQVGKTEVMVLDPPDDVYGMKSQAFEVLMNPMRFDINRSDPETTNRIDGMDLVYLVRDFDINEVDPNYDPDNDFDGNGWVDGADFSHLWTGKLGMCWSASSKTWSVPCRTGSP